MSDAAHGHDNFHMPPNSWVPISLSLALTMTMTGLLVGPAVWGTGLLWVVVTLVQWFRAARNEFLALPEDLSE